MGVFFYLRSKIDHQIYQLNHKISSMLSLVSTLAEDLNVVKINLNHQNLRGGEPHSENKTVDIHIQENLGNDENCDLIEVSDDEEDSYNDEDENCSYEDDIDCDDIDCDDIDCDDIDCDDIDCDEEDNDINNSLEQNDEILDASNFDNISEPEMNNEYVKCLLSGEPLKITESTIVLEQDFSKDLKTIDIKETSNLEEIKTVHLDHEQLEEVDYKKLPLTKLRNIVVEKGLMSLTEASKLKKHELLKWLGVE